VITFYNVRLTILLASRLSNLITQHSGLKTYIQRHSGPKYPGSPAYMYITIGVRPRGITQKERGRKGMMYVFMNFFLAASNPRDLSSKSRVQLDTCNRKKREMTISYSIILGKTNSSMNIKQQ
jgi:hypothetical protein